MDVVVSDVDMPRMNGFALTATIRASTQHAGIPVILVSSRATEEDKAKGIQVGASAYIVKSGFNQAQLLDVIGQLV